jgi:hypothetical protein
MADIRWDKERLRVGLDVYPLRTFGCGAPKSDPICIMVMVIKCDELLLASDEPALLTMAEPLFGLGQTQTYSRQPIREVL